MKYRDLQIQTQREAPNNARTEGFSLLVRAGYVSRENKLTKLGEYAIDHLRNVSGEAMNSLSGIGNQKETFFPIASGDLEVVHCRNCQYSDRLERARFAKPAGMTRESPLPIEKVPTPDCNTIESLATYLGVPKEKTAKALMYTRPADEKFIFVVVRGDMQLSEAKLKAQVGGVRAAGTEEILRAGAVPGYASAIGLREAVIVVDDQIPQSPNLVAGANEAGYHFINTNYGRDYSAEVIADLVQAKEGDACLECGYPLSVVSAMLLSREDEFDFENILLALAETHHDDKGLTLPHPAAPFAVYLMQIPGRELDTRVQAEEIYTMLRSAGVSVLFDDREERAGVKFNDADLIGLPIRVTAGEKGLKDGMVEVKPRQEKEIRLVAIEKTVEEITSLLK
jgi:prolyl-tRNA synthetase